MAAQNHSPGNSLYPESPLMRLPHLSFLYRLECLTEKQSFEVGAPYGSGLHRSIVNIVSGTFKGPRLQGDVLPGGADWAQVIDGTHSIILDARYTARTDDGEYLYISAKGQYRPGPETDYAKSDPKLDLPEVVTQDDVEFFSHLTIEAGPGKYNWLNGLVVLGVMTSVAERVIIDAYYLTNFPDRQPSTFMATK